MPIQFRCQNCRQLLGISRSRAGSVVDCPACGRSLRVPAVDGVAAEPETAHRSAADSSLLSALEELSKLSTESAAAPPVSPSRPLKSRRLRTPPAAAEQDASGEKDTMRILPLSARSPASRQMPPQDDSGEMADTSLKEDPAPLVVPELFDSEESEQASVSEPHGTAPLAVAEYETQSDRAAASTPEPGSESDTESESEPGSEFEPESEFETESASKTAFELPARFSTVLEELAGYVPQTAEPRQPLPAQRGGVLMWMTLLVVTALIAFAAGYLVARSRGPATAGLTPEKKEGSPQNPVQPAIRNESGAVQSISGTVVFSDAGGASKPDAGALILLLPSANTSGLKLDARPLRELQTSPAKAAVEAALNTLGVTLVRAGENGDFAMERRHSGPAKLVIVSRHSSRPDSEPIKPSVASTLADWFESPSHLTGRLSVQEKSLSAIKAGTADPPLTVTFGK